jgi:hypothetical protein
MLWKGCRIKTFLLVAEIWLESTLQLRVRKTKTPPFACADRGGVLNTGLLARMH